MTTAELWARARRLANVNSTQWTDADILIDTNVIYQDLVETIVNRVWEDLFVSRFNSDSQVWITWYDLQEATATAKWHKKIKRVSVQYVSGWEFQVLNEVSQNSLWLSLEQYAENTPTFEAFFFLNGNKVHIFPAPTAEITDAVRIESSITPIDLVAGWAEALNLIPRQFHNIIVEWMLKYIFQHLWKTDLKNDAINNYERLKNDMVTELSDRITAPLGWMLPWLRHLE